MNKVRMSILENAKPPEVWANGLGMGLRAYALSAGRHPIKIVIPPYTPRLIRTGLTLLVPDGHLAFILSRRDDALKGVQVVNAPVGFVNNEEIQFVLHNASSEIVYIQNGDLVANLVIMTGTPLIYERV